MGTVKEGDFQNENNHRWNNKCIPMYYRLTEKFMDWHGAIDMAMVENALNGFRLAFDDLNKVAAHHMYSADYKWIYSIDIPPRFWEAAAVGTISLYPAWTANQTHFPDLKPWAHYVPFDEAFEGIASVMDIKEGLYDSITNDCRDIYKMWIAGEEYGISINLMNRIFNSIEEAK
jgi:hypothetical protein